MKTPKKVIGQIFKANGLDYLSNNLWKWLQAAITNDNSAYEMAAERAGLMLLYDHLLILLEALYILTEKKRALRQYTMLYRLTPELKEQLKNTDQPKLLSQDEKENPFIIIRHFFKLFSLDYLRAELLDWLEAGISCDNHLYDTGLKRSYLLLLYQHIACLIEAAYIMKENQNKNDS